MNTRDLVDRAYERLARVAEESGTEALPELRRHVLLTWWARWIIGNGGFRYFFEGATNALEVANAFAALGFPEAAEAFRQSVSIFPGHLPPESQDDRIEWMDSHEDAVEAFFDPLFDPVMDVAQELETRIVEYLRKHDPSFLAEIARTGS